MSSLKLGTQCNAPDYQLLNESLITIVESSQNKLELMLPYRNNLGWLRDTIQLGSNFNPLVNQNRGFHWTVCRQLKCRMHKHKIWQNYEIDLRSVNPIHRIQENWIITVCYRSWSCYESSVNLIRGNSIELILNYIEITNQIEVSFD